MPPTPVNDTKRRLLDLMKRSDGSKVADLAIALGISDNAVRQHLDDLAGNGLIEARTAPSTGKRGRPSSLWHLTDLATELFPDRHADLTVDLIEAIRTASGEDGLDAVITARSERQRADYLSSMPEGGLADRVQALAARRTDEGYLAEVVDDGDRLLLIEHHCPICDAAAVCQGLCRDELKIFRDVIGDDATVERTTHALAGDQRCTYEIRRK